jgi:hypothetical protein
MQKASIVCTLLLLTIATQGQIKPPLAIEEFKEGLNPLEEIRLFDLKEIQKRRIDTVYIIYHPASWAEYHQTNPCSCSYNDTLTRYVFDTEGRITEYTYFQQLGDYSTTIHYDTLGNRTALTQYRRYGSRAGSNTLNFDSKSDTSEFKQAFNRKKIGGDSIITIISFLKFTHGLDTATVETKRYNAKGKLVETESSVNKRNARELDDDTRSSTYHFKYNYDDSGRLIYYRDYFSHEYEKISYPYYGMLTEIYDASSNRLKYRNTKMIKEVESVISVTFDRKQVTLTPLERGSRLYKLRTILEQGDFPLLYYHEIVYKVRKA